MSLGSSAHALNLQTNINQNRYFFATQEAGEQQLYLSTSIIGGLSTQILGISGPAGNEVNYTTAPYFVASEFLGSDQGLGVGGSSTYWTQSTINTSLSGISLSTDRIPGSGIACIESYGTNGQGGFEFLSRGVNSEVVSTTQTYMDNYLSSIGSPGATALLQPTGALNVSLGMTTPFYTSLQPSLSSLRSHYGIQDLSGPLGITRIPRWTIGTSNLATGGDAGTDLCIFGFSDNGTYLGNYLEIQRANGAMNIPNISTVTSQVSTGVYAPVFPCSKDNVEFGIPGAGNTTAITDNLTVLFSTPVTGLNPNTQTLLNINWGNALSTGSGFVNFKVGFSTATAYTNILQTAYIPGGNWTPGGAPSTISHTNICCILDPDGIAPNGTGFLYVAGQLLDASADTLYLDKGPVSEPTRNALCYRPI